MTVRIYDNEIRPLPNTGIIILATPTDILKGLLDQLAPAFTRAMVDAGHKRNRGGCTSRKHPLDVLLEVVRAERQRARAAKLKRTVTKRASRKRVAV